MPLRLWPLYKLTKRKFETSAGEIVQFQKYLVPIFVWSVQFSFLNKMHDSCSMIDSRFFIQKASHCAKNVTLMVNNLKNQILGWILGQELGHADAPKSTLNKTLVCLESENLSRPLPLISRDHPNIQIEKLFKPLNRANRIYIGLKMKKWTKNVEIDICFCLGCYFISFEIW